MQVFVLTIEHKHGLDVTAYRTREAADQALADYCSEQWESEMPEGETCPESAIDRVARYFDHVEGEYANAIPCDI